VSVLSFSVKWCYSVCVLSEFVCQGTVEQVLVKQLFKKAEPLAQLRGM